VRAVLVGLGAVGARSARHLLSSNALSELVVLSRHPDKARKLVSNLGGGGAVRLAELTTENARCALQATDVLVVAAPCAAPTLAPMAVGAGVPVVSVADDPDEVRQLLELDGQACRRGVSVAVGAAMAPGLSCLLAAWAAARMDEVSEVHVSTLGTGGPACARRRHAALREMAEEWYEGAPRRRVASSGRELVWFPGSAGADCYRTNRPDALLLAAALPGLRNATARAAASRRDRMTSWLPMLRPPHPEGTVGAVRVEVRGRRAGAAESVLLGAIGRPALLAGQVAAGVAVRAAGRGLLPGVGGLASVVADPGELLADLVERGVRVMSFEGASLTPAW